MIPELQEIERILLKEWDPIGVDGIPEASDEYNSYAFHIFTMLKSGWTEPDVAAYLEWAARENMGLGGESFDEAIAADARVIARKIATIGKSAK